MTNAGTDDANADVREFGYERARDELVNVVKMLEQGGLDLDDSLQLWERGEALAKRCEEHLAGARERVEQALSLADDEDEDEYEDDEDLSLTISPRPIRPGSAFDRPDPDQGSSGSALPAAVARVVNSASSPDPPIRMRTSPKSDTQSASTPSPP